MQIASHSLTCMVVSSNTEAQQRVEMEPESILGSIWVLLHFHSASVLLGHAPSSWEALLLGSKKSQSKGMQSPQTHWLRHKHHPLCWKRIFPGSFCLNLTGSLFQIWAVHETWSPEIWFLTLKWAHESMKEWQQILESATHLGYYPCHI